MPHYQFDQQLRSRVTRAERMWDGAPGLVVVLAFAVSCGLLSWAGAVVYTYLVRGFVGITADVIGFSVGWVAWLTAGFLLAPRRRERGVWLGYVTGACLAVSSGGAAWWLATLVAGSLIVPVWSVVVGAVVGTVGLFLLPRSLTDRRLQISRQP